MEVMEHILLLGVSHGCRDFYTWLVHTFLHFRQVVSFILPNSCFDFLGTHLFLPPFFFPSPFRFYFPCRVAACANGGGGGVQPNESTETKIISYRQSTQIGSKNVLRTSEASELEINIFQLHECDFFQYAADILSVCDILCVQNYALSKIQMYRQNYENLFFPVWYVSNRFKCI